MCGESRTHGAEEGKSPKNIRNVRLANVVELRPAHLGLAADEYIIEIILFFGQVPAGFTSVERPRIFVDVLSTNQLFCQTV